MKVFQVHIADKALDEIKSQFQYIRGDSPGAAAKWLRDIHATIDTLERMPRRSPLAQENEHVENELRQLVFKKNWRILFTIEGDLVHVIRVRHGRRRKLEEVREPTDEQDTKRSKSERPRDERDREQ